jgi:membrane protein
MPRYLLWSYRKAGQDQLFPQAGSLAFLTLFSLVPLLATFSFFGARFLEQPELVSTLAALLPYREGKIAEVLQEFVEAAGSLSGLGFIFFLVTVISGFNSVEEVINKIWDVPKRRSWYSRLTSFILVLLGGPMLLAGAYWAIFYLKSNPRLSGIAEVGLVQVLPFVLSVVALTLLNWQVPNTYVKLKSALIGGATSAVLLEILRRGFGLYVENATDISVVYGSFGIAIFFLFSIQAAWIIVLLGTEIAYSAQNFEVLSRPNPHSALDGCRLGLLAMILAVEKFRAGSPRVTHEYFAGRLGLTSGELRRVLQPLAKKGFLLEDSDDEGGWLLAADPHAIRVKEIFTCFDQSYEDVHAGLPPETAASLEQLFGKLDAQRKRQLGELTVVDLLPVARPAAVDESQAEEAEEPSGDRGDKPAKPAGPQSAEAQPAEAQPAEPADDAVGEEAKDGASR